MMPGGEAGHAMRYTDIAIIGGGLAGSTAAAMLGRAGIATILIDPHKVYPLDLRCEKLGGDQLDLLRKTGQYGILYDTLVNTMRG